MIAHIPGRLLDPLSTRTWPITVTLEWRPSAEWEVTMDVSSRWRWIASDAPIWSVSRELLASGLDMPSGYGDVTVFPALTGRVPAVEIILSVGGDPDGPCDERVGIRVPIEPVRTFLTAAEYLADRAA